MMRIYPAPFALSALLFAPVAFAQGAPEPSPSSPGVIEKVESAVERGAKATANAVESVAGKVAGPQASPPEN